MVKKTKIYAAVDLGSNSFHMIVAEIINNQLHVIDRHKDMVRLANGLDDNGNLSQIKMDEAIISLEKIGQRIAHIPKSRLRVVGTNTLRKAKNASEFMTRASQALGKPIDIISGREEARILYLGVAHSLPNDQGKRLVLDIGGGSTELIIGEGFVPLLRESLHMGCVSYTRKYFSNGEISQNNWDKAVLHARRQLLPIVKKYTQKGWDITIGASGTMRATAKVILENEYSVYGIDEKGLNKLISHCLVLKDIAGIKNLLGLSARRAPVFIGGIAIIKGLFESLNLSQIESCTGALREGIIYDLSGRLSHNDVRKRTTDKLCKQFEIDKKQSIRVQDSINHIIRLSHNNFSASQKDLLMWAAWLHELGLNISHSHFEKHAAYILIHADMPGFSIQEQLKLAVLVASQRRKIKKEWLRKLSDYQYTKLRILIAILRLAILLNRSRIDCPNTIESVDLNEKTFSVKFIPHWLDNHPLTQTDLQSEAGYLKTLGLSSLFF